MEDLITHSAICFPQFLEELLDGISLNYFEPTNVRILRSVLDLIHQERLVNLNTLELLLGKDFMDSPEFLKVLKADIVPDYLRLKNDLKQFLRLKKQTELSVKLAMASRSGSVFDQDFLDRYIDLDYEVKLRTLDEWISVFESSPDIPKLSTGIDFLDQHLDGGFELGQLVLVGGDPEAGKTLLTIQMAEFMLRNVKACFFCFEFSVLKYVRGLIQRGYQFLPRHYFIEDDFLGFDEFLYTIKLLITKKGVKVFVIDSQQMIKHRRLGANAEESESEKFSFLQTLAKRYGVLIFLIVQSSKVGKSSPFGSAKGGYLAHVYLQLTRPKFNECQWANASQRFFIRKLVILKNKQTGKAGFQYFMVDVNVYRLVACRSDQVPVMRRYELDPSAFEDATSEVDHDQELF